MGPAPFPSTPRLEQTQRPHVHTLFPIRLPPTYVYMTTRCCCSPSSVTVFAPHPRSVNPFYDSLSLLLCVRRCIRYIRHYGQDQCKLNSALASLWFHYWVLTLPLTISTLDTIDITPTLRDTTTDDNRAGGPSIGLQLSLSMVMLSITFASRMSQYLMMS